MDVQVNKKKDGKVILNIGLFEMSDLVYSSSPEKLRFPRSYGIRNTKGNEELYLNLLKYVGKTLRVESTQINGLFTIGLDGEEIVLKESL
ncbi:hypothetical protein [Bacillus sp. AG4(2022)]|uniref:hypothetical protein n=1 Tax=Bacillus sp. AG4(2022) TaxID=2962594 RepID=UPI00288292FE|nr:hypothetical protein [Bacillus sp. AG4(2022)]MDT0160349.1 hypothetical protein [Bacillus sp. AG4(2022)]